MADYIPGNESQITIWLNNFKTELATYGSILGLTPDDMTNLIDACDGLIANINAVETAKTNLSKAVATKNTEKASALELIRTEIARMKTNANYTEAIGKSMSITSEAVTPDLNAMKPELSAEVFPGYVRIKFTKKGFTGVNVYTRIKGTIDWVFLSRDTNSPYEDKRLLGTPGAPETREYMAIGLKGDDEIGQQSDIVSVVFGG